MAQVTSGKEDPEQIRYHAHLPVPASPGKLCDPQIVSLRERSGGQNLCVGRRAGGKRGFIQKIYPSPWINLVLFLLNEI